MKTNDSIDQAQVFKDWLIAKMENVRYRYEHGGGDWPDLSACWEFVNEAGHRAATLGWSDLAEEARTHDLDDFRSVIVFLSKCLARCSDPSMSREEVLLTEQEGILASSLDDASEGLESEAPPKLATRYEKAYQSFLVAANETCREVTDREAYDWIELNLTDKYDDLPDFPTWSRYLRAAREHYGTQKNSPRAGRSGRSIVRHDQK